MKVIIYLKFVHVLFIYVNTHLFCEMDALVEIPEAGAYWS